MKTLLFLVFVLASASVAGTDAFDRRVAIAKQLEDTPQGQAYDHVLYGAIGDYMQKAMVQCFPHDVKADTERFTLVADILANGTAARVQVWPDTKMAACFGEKFQAAPFPALPAYANADDLPIFIDMKIDP